MSLHYSLRAFTLSLPLLAACQQPEQYEMVGGGELLVCDTSGACEAITLPSGTTVTHLSQQGDYAHYSIQLKTAGDVELRRVSSTRTTPYVFRAKRTPMSSP